MFTQQQHTNSTENKSGLACLIHGGRRFQACVVFKCVPPHFSESKRSSVRQPTPLQTQELSSAVGTSSRPSDLTILSTAATQLFAATASMEDAAVLSMIMGLREVSQRSLLYGTLQPAAAPVRLFAVGRMVEVLQNNRHRLPDLWRVFAAHVGDILANSSVRPAVRVAAAEVLGRAVSALLSSPPLQQHQGPILQPASSVNTECMLLRSLRSLQQEAVEQDAALGILRVCTTVLQHHGAWPGGGVCEGQCCGKDTGSIAVAWELICRFVVGASCSCVAGTRQCDVNV